MSTLEMVLTGLAFIAIGLPICIMFAAVAVCMLPILVWQLWTLALLVVRYLYDLSRDEWGRRRATAAQARRRA